MNPLAFALRANSGPGQHGRGLRVCNGRTAAKVYQMIQPHSAVGGYLLSTPPVSAVLGALRAGTGPSDRAVACHSEPFWHRQTVLAGLGQGCRRFPARPGRRRLQPFA